jgi:hypothetical protein
MRSLSLHASHELCRQLFRDSLRRRPLLELLMHPVNQMTPMDLLDRPLRDAASPFVKSARIVFPYPIRSCVWFVFGCHTIRY